MRRLVCPLLQALLLPGMLLTWALLLPASAAAAGWQPDNRLILGIDAAALTGTRGGYGGNIGYLQQFSPAAVAGIGAQYQSLGGSQWEYGSLDGSYGHALTSSTRWNLSVELHEGRGQTGPRRFDYGIEALAGGLSLPGGLTLSAEARQIDVDTSHGSLPKLSVSEALGAHWLASASYAHSSGGNLATEYGLLRVDFLSAPVNLLAGASIGHVAPAVLDIAGVLQPQARRLTEGFFGVTRHVGRVDCAVLADELDLAGIHRFTLTLTATVHLR
jgi:hypothetical protein